jgi:hypothetical protein
VPRCNGSQTNIVLKRSREPTENYNDNSTITIGSKETAMLQVISDRITESVSRRSFLGRIVSAAGLIAFTLLGVTPAYALYFIDGCRLCKNPGSCSYGTCNTQTECQWCWMGNAVDNGDGTHDFYQCCECYTTHNPCPPNPNDLCNPSPRCSKTVYDHTSGGGGIGGGGCKPTICG